MIFIIYQSFFTLLLLNAPFANTKDLEVTCYNMEEEYVGQTCFAVDKMCVVDIVTAKDPNTNLLFTNANEENFTSLSFVQSHVAVLPKEVFDQFPFLTHLQLQSTALTEIKINSFAKASQLMTLNLQMNELTEIGDATFDGAKNLIKLELAFNLIENISPRAFNAVPELQFLNLASNKISVLHPKTFFELTNLKSLLLFKNLLKYLDSQLFIKNTELRSLNLNNNQLDELELKLASSNMDDLNVIGNSLWKVSLYRFD